MSTGIRAGVRRWLTLPSRRSAVIHDDVDDELAFYLAARIEHLTARGMSPDEARAEALRRLGGTLDETRARLHSSAERRERRMRMHEWIRDLGQDVRYGARSLRRERLLSGFVIATLALGIGANAAMFGVVDRLLLRGPAHVRQADRVMRLYFTMKPPWLAGEEQTSSAFGFVTYANMRHAARRLAGVAAFAGGDAIMGSGADAQPVQAAYATSDFFPLLGVQASLGRFFDASEDRTSGAEHVAVLGYGLWQRGFGGDRAAIGRMAAFDGQAYRIIGVAPAGFTGTQLAPVDVWLPLSLRGTRTTPGEDWTRSWNVQWLQVIVRLSPGVTARQASADATTAFRQTYDGTEKWMRDARLTVAPLGFNGQAKESTEASVSRWLMGVAIIVLLIACANVVNLLLARGLKRRREVAVRLALGATRARLTRLLLSESVLLALAGGLAGLIVARLMGGLIRGILLPGAEWPTSPVDSRVLAVSAAIALATGIAVGLVPALTAGRLDLTAGLKAGVREGGGRGSHVRGTLMVTQAALSVVLLVGAGLFVRSLWRVQSLDLGIQPERVLTVSVRWPNPRQGQSTAPGTTLSSVGASSPENQPRQRERAFYSLALERIARMHGVEHASLAVGVSFQTSFRVHLRVPGRDSIPALPGGGPFISAITGDYFATVGTRLLRGRTFTPAERAGSERVAIVSETMAKTLWPARDPIGQCLIHGADTMPCSRIVGVVADAHQSELRDKPSMHYYVPFGQEVGFPRTSLLIRPGGDPEALVGEVRRALLAAEPTLRYVDISSLQTAIEPQVRPWRLGAIMFGLCGLLGLLVAALGLYSVVSYLVEQRTHEIGVRIALGAEGVHIVAMILRSSLGMAALGVTVGIALALLGGRYVEPLLFDTSPRDPAVLGVVALTLVLVAAVAGMMPAARARRVDPMEALRAE